MRKSQQDSEKKQRRFDQLLAEERANLQKVNTERDAFAQESRDRETKILLMSNELQAMRTQLDEINRVKQTLQLELDEMVYQF